MAIEDTDILDDNLTVRVNSTVLEKFKDNAQRISGKPYPLLVREIMTALNEGRLRITPTKEQKKSLGELYK